MAPSWSKFEGPLRASCKEILHPWTDSCNRGALDFADGTFSKIFKFYITIYSVSFLLKRRKPKKKDVLNVLSNTLRSSVFFYLQHLVPFAFMCYTRKIVGGFYPVTYVFVPALIGGFLTLLMEKPSRVSVLTDYFANIALETTFLMLEDRGYVKGIKNGQVLMLSTAVAIYAYLMKSRDEAIAQKNVLKTVLGSIWGNEIGAKEFEYPRQLQRFGTHLRRILGLEGNLASATGRKHQLCNHSKGCLYHVTEGFIRPFVFGYVLRSVLNLIRVKGKVVRQPSTFIYEVLLNGNNASFGTTLGLFGGLFKLVSCLLRWTRNRDEPKHALLAGFVAGLSFLRAPNTTLSVYLTLQIFKIYYNKAVEAGYLPSLRSVYFEMFVTSFCEAISLHAVFFEPQNLQRGYLNFSNNYINHRIIDFPRRITEFCKRNQLTYKSEFLNLNIK